MTGRAGLAVRAVVPWRPLAAAALLALSLGVSLSQGLAGEPSSFALGAVSSAGRSGHGFSSLPSAVRAPVSAAIGANDAAYRLRVSPGGFQASNPAQHLGI